MFPRRTIIRRNNIGNRTKKIRNNIDNKIANMRQKMENKHRQFDKLFPFHEPHKSEYDDNFNGNNKKGLEIPTEKELKDGIVYDTGDTANLLIYCTFFHGKILIMTDNRFGKGPSKKPTFDKVTKFKRVFISAFYWGKLDSDQKQPYNKYKYDINEKKYIFHSLVTDNKKRSDVRLGGFILIHIKSNKYKGIYDYIFDFETPDNDKIIYVSQGGSTKSQDMSPFAIGEKYTYYFSSWNGNWYFDNSAMMVFNEIDPWKIYGKNEKLFDTYKKN